MIEFLSKNYNIMNSDYENNNNDIVDFDYVYGHMNNIHTYTYIYNNEEYIYDMSSIDIHNKNYKNIHKIFES